MQKIRITESKLRKIISEAVSSILNEDEFGGPQPMKTVTVYQLDRNKPGGEERMFTRWEWLDRFNMPFDPSLYKVVYDGPLPVRTPEDCYSFLNAPTMRPEGYNGHSLSVSDIVKMAYPNESEERYYFCDAEGFRDVTEYFNTNA